MSGISAGRSTDRDPVFACRSESCDAIDPLQVFAAAGSAPRFYWEQPSAARYRVGVGAAARIRVSGAGRHAEAEAAARELFARLRWEGDGPRIGRLLGAFAFAPDGPRGETWDGFPNSELFLPELVHALEDGKHDRAVLQGSRWASLQPRPLALAPPARGVVEICNGGPDAYRRQVELALEAIRGGRLSKVVLAREVHVASSSSIDAVAWLLALRERFPTCTLFAVGQGDAVFLGASPERLVRVRGPRVETAALAGTAPRGASRAADRALGEALCDSSKNGAEHDFVVRHIESVLRECCDDVEVAREPTLLRNRTVQHLCTDIRARRRDVAPVSLLDLVGRLHPTPAVGGAPREAALEWLSRHESFDRGWFAGPVGYLQSDGDGEFAVALRSALLRGRHATAWAGAGVVARSDPTAEYTETELKLRAVLGPLLWGAP